MHPCGAESCREGDGPDGRSFGVCLPYEGVSGLRRRDRLAGGLGYFGECH